jgi:hypothetical protein
MNTQTLRRNIGAYGALLDYASKKRYGVKYLDFPQDKSGDIARTLNTKIAEKSGIDIFQPVSDAEVERYEDVVSAELTKYIKVHIPPQYESDEDEFLKNVVRLSPHYFENLFVKIDEQFKHESKGFGTDISEEILKAVTRTPDYIDCAHIENPFGSEYPGMNCYLVTKYFDKVQPEMAFAIIRQDHDKQYGVLGSAFVLKLPQFLSNRENPSKIFFQILDKIGVDIEFNGETKRFFSGTIISQTGEAYFQQKNHEIMLKKHIERSFTHIAYVHGNVADSIAFAYCIDISKYKTLRKKYQI